MRFPREKGRAASFYRHPMGKRVNDLVLYHERERDDLIADAVISPPDSGYNSIYAYYGGIDAYIEAMEHIYGNKQIHDSVWDVEAMQKENVFPQCSNRVFDAMKRNYRIVCNENKLESEWVPVFWFASPAYTMSIQVFIENMLKSLDLVTISTFNICMYSTKCKHETRIYMRRSFLENFEWGRSKMFVFSCLTHKYIIEHRL